MASRFNAAYSPQLSACVCNALDVGRFVHFILAVSGWRFGPKADGGELKAVSEPLMNYLRVPQHRAGKKECVYSVQYPPVPRQQVSGILDPSRSFQSRFGQVANLSGHVDDGS
jgi:hypothetical protein